MGRQGWRFLRKIRDFKHTKAVKKEDGTTQRIKMRHETPRRRLRAKEKNSKKR